MDFEYKLELRTDDDMWTEFTRYDGTTDGLEAAQKRQREETERLHRPMRIRTRMLYSK